MPTIKELKEIASSFCILYVEDEEQIAKNIIIYLSKIFSTVIYAKNGQEALDLYEKDAFDIIISDIKMPKINGLKLASEIKKQNSQQVIVFLTAFSEEEILLESIKIGIDGYIIKPIDLNEINNLLYKLCLNLKNSYENKINIEQQKQLMDHICDKNTLLRQYTDIIDQVAIVSKTDLKGKIIHVNDLFCEISGYNREELIGKSHNIVRHQDMNPTVYANMWETIKCGEIWNGTIKNKAKDGSSYFVHATIIPIKEHGVTTEYVGIRFLSTSAEVEKRDFRKKVRTNILEFKKSNYALNSKIQEQDLELQLKAKKELIYESKMKDITIRLDKALSQITYYEKIRLERNKYDSIEQYQKNLQELTVNYQHTRSELHIKKEELYSIKTDNENKANELINLNQELIQQSKIMKELRDIIKSEKEVKESKDAKNSFFDRFK